MYFWYFMLLYFSLRKPKNWIIIGLSCCFWWSYTLSKTSLNLDMLFTWVIFLISVSLSWGLGFALLKKFKIGKNLKDVTWLSIYSILPMLFLCFLFEGIGETIHNIANLSIMRFLCIIFVTCIPTIWVGYL